MKENVGRADQIMRSIVGPGLVALGYSKLGGDYGRPAGLLTMLAGWSVIESAITRTCPINALLGLDTREPNLARADLADDVRQQVRRLMER